MRKTLYSLLAAVMLAGCGGPEADLEGTWKFAPEMIEAELKGVAPNRRARAQGEMEAMRMTFKGGKFYYEAPGSAAAEGTYRVIDVQDNKLTIVTRTSEGQEVEQTIEIDGDTFTTMLERRRATFIRVK